MRFATVLVSGLTLLVAVSATPVWAQMSGAPGFSAPAWGLQPYPLSSPLANAKPAVPADIERGVTVYGSDGRTIGYVQGRDDQRALISRSGGAIGVPLSAFGKTRGGLVLELTKAQFDDLSFVPPRPR